MTRKTDILLSTAHQVLEDEIRSLQDLNMLLDECFEKACELVVECEGRVIFTGVGHSGHVGKKSAANMSSFNTPAYFLHAGEASHGDLGLVQKDDLVILISNSGETTEVLAILPQIKRLGVKTIAIVGNMKSSLALSCDIVLPIRAEEEAGPFKFAGSSSALNSMALCDAMVMAIAAYQGFTEKDYLNFHPGGAVGKKLSEKYKLPSIRITK
ncbi:MAG: SIS domain-containing protein [Anaerolineaceae bacterium]|nr:SIS domain-containing protein [Anaerolineaceae bacterium]